MPPVSIPCGSMKHLPLISVITPVSNCANSLPDCIESVMSQGYARFEHLIVDSDSKDGTVEVLSRYQHLRWLSEPIAGEGEALNKALRVARGEIVLWLNGDERLEPGAFAAILSALEKFPDAAVVYGSCAVFESASAQRHVVVPCATMSTYELIRWWSCEGHPHRSSVCFSRAALESIGLFREDLLYSIDYDVFLKLAKSESFARIDAVLANVPLSPKSHPAGSEHLQIQEHWEVVVPFVRALPPAQQVEYWRDYYVHRATNPVPYEESRVPSDEAACQGLVSYLGSSTDEVLAQKFSTIFKGDEAQEQVMRLLEQCSTKEKVAPSASKNIKVAEDYAGDLDLTKISQESDFARSIREIFTQYRPTKIIETGTYLGTGTTSVIASTLRQLGLNDTRFYSIEVNPQNIAQAQYNLTQAGLAPFVRLCHGLSVPRSILPTVEQIEESCVRNIEFDDIFVDHREHNRATLYYQETNFDGVEEDLLGKALKAFDDRPDFVILDSAGHMGFVEFSYLLEKLKGPCIIALDDVYHIKHHKSFSRLKRDPRFQVLADSREKFGFCIAQFTPAPLSVSVTVDSDRGFFHSSMLPQQASRILWVRTDSIGDNVLGASTIEPLKARYPAAEIAVVCQERVAQLFAQCPFVSKIMTFRLDDPSTLFALEKEVCGWNADLTFNTAYSRDVLSDRICGWAAGATAIAFEGDEQNRGVDQSPREDSPYTALVTEIDTWMPEIEKYDALLSGLGIHAAACKPIVWRDPISEQTADSFFRELQIPKEKAIAFAPGAQLPGRIYERFSETMAMLADAGYVIVGLGAECEAEYLGRAIRGTGMRAISLFGKTSLTDLAALISRCALMIGAESGPAHIACAVGTPNVVILGSGHFGRFMPYSALTSAVSTPVSCARCNWYCHYETTACVKDIDPIVVRQAVQDRLMQPASERARLYLSVPAISQRALRMYPSAETDYERYTEFGDVIVVREGVGTIAEFKGSSRGRQSPATVSGMSLSHS